MCVCRRTTLLTSIACVIIEVLSKGWSGCWIYIGSFKHVLFQTFPTHSTVKRKNSRLTVCHISTQQTFFSLGYDWICKSFFAKVTARRETSTKGSVSFRVMALYLHDWQRVRSIGNWFQAKYKARHIQILTFIIPQNVKFQTPLFLLKQVLGHLDKFYYCAFESQNHVRRLFRIVVVVGFFLLW